MSTQKFFKGEAMRFGWTTMKNNISFFIVFLIVVALISIPPVIIAAIAEEDDILIALIFSIISNVLQMVIGMGFIRIAIKFTDGLKGKFGDLFAVVPLFFKYLFGSILYGLIILGGIILLIIPGIIWAIKFQFFGYFIVDKGLGPIQALKRSSAITKGSKWNLFLFALLLMGINLLGAATLLIGLFATIPTTMVAWAFVYRKLLAQTEASSIKEAQTETKMDSKVNSKVKWDKLAPGIFGVVGFGILVVLVYLLYNWYEKEWFMGPSNRAECYTEFTKNLSLDIGDRVVDYCDKYFDIYDDNKGFFHPVDEPIIHELKNYKCFLDGVEDCKVLSCIEALEKGCLIKDDQIK